MLLLVVVRRDEEGHASLSQYIDAEMEEVVQHVCAALVKPVVDAGACKTAEDLLVALFADVGGFPDHDVETRRPKHLLRVENWAASANLNGSKLLSWRVLRSISM